MDKEELLIRAFARCLEALKNAPLAETLSLRKAAHLLNKSGWISYALPKGFRDRVQRIYTSMRAGVREDREVRRLRTAEQVRSTAWLCPSASVLPQACRVAGQGPPCFASQPMQLQLCGVEQTCLEHGPRDQGLLSDPIKP